VRAAAGYWGICTDLQYRCGRPLTSLGDRQGGLGARCPESVSGGGAGGARRACPWRKPNLDWVLPGTDAGTVSEEDLILLADAQTSGGPLVAGEIPGAPVIGELAPRRGSVLIIR
jgi:hypothetical protein